MTHERLATAAEFLHEAAELVEDNDTRERLESQAETLREAAERDRGLDHGALARITHFLDDFSADAAGEEEVQQAIAEAKREVVAYRETVEGV